MQKNQILKKVNPFQKTIEEKNTIIKESVDKKCTGMLSKMGLVSEDVKLQEKKKKKSIDQINQE